MSTLQDAIAWIRDEVNPQGRQWEEFYRNRWQHDKVVRSTHGVNCTGGCTWNIHVKDGIVTWEMQGLDYPMLEAGLPPYEPRGCQRGISYSWYLYSPLRVKYPYIRGALLDLWRRARANHEDPVEAWKSLVEDPAARRRWQQARGKGGLRRIDWDAVLEIIAASMIYTIKKHGPDRIAGFSPIPAMSMISYASGARLMQLIGGDLAVVLRLVLRSAHGIARDLGRANGCPGERRLVSRQDVGFDGGQHRHDADAGLSFSGRGPAQRHEALGLLTRLQHGGKVRRRMGGAEYGAGRCLVDGGEPRAADANFITSSRRNTFWTTPASTRMRRTWLSSRRTKRDVFGPGSCCAPAV